MSFPYITREPTGRGMVARLRVGGLLLVGLLSLAVMSCSDDPPAAPPADPLLTGALRGKVTVEDTADQLVNVKISVADTIVSVDSAGEFFIDSLPVGAYDVIAIAEDRIFLPASVNVTLDSGVVRQADFLMLRRRISDSVPMVRIPAGTFRMGNDEQELLFVPSAIPRHEVLLTRSFLVAKYEVTQRQWSRLMHRDPSPVQGADLPVMNMTYDSVIVFCNRLSVLFDLEPVYSGFGSGVVIDHSKNGFRLLTEAEWEFAASAGDTTSLYAVEDPVDGYRQADYERVIKQINQYAWTEDNTGGAFGSPQPVGRLKPNGYGLHDMIGNVQEMVEDTWLSFSAEPAIDPLVLVPEQYRVARGSSFGHLLLQNHSLRYRETVRWAVGSPSVGFRLARTP